MSKLSTKELQDRVDMHAHCGAYVKPRSDAWDANLTEAQRWQAYAQFRRSSWFETSAWIAEQFGIPAPSRSALYRWNNRMREQESDHRIEQTIITRVEVGKLAQAAGQNDAELIEAYKTLGADLAFCTGDAKKAEKFTGMALALNAAQLKKRDFDLKERAQSTKEETLRLAREKFEAAEARLNKAKEVVGDSKLSDAERTAKMKEIFGL